jgi:dTDP-4-dehydrorhamnose 3,5-epimerase
MGQRLAHRWGYERDVPVADRSLRLEYRLKRLGAPSLQITPTALGGLLLIERHRHADARGFFSRLFCAEELAVCGFDAAVAQVNHSYTRQRGSVRGMHFQYPPHGEVKFVSCLRGEVFDVAVDLRCGSPTYLQWHAERLSESNACSLLIPRGFAHGFQTLSNDCELLYVHSAPYAADAEGGLNPNDATLGIRWPLPFSDISERDAMRPALTAGFTGLGGS